MSEPSTPKRQLLVGDDITWNKDYASHPKRNKHVAVSTGSQGSRSSSRNSCRWHSNPYISNDATEGMEICFDHAGPTLPAPVPVRVLPQNPSHPLDLRHASALSQSPSQQQDDNICFGMLTDIEIRISRLQTRQPIDFDEVGSHENTFACLELVIDEHRCNIQVKGVSVATMNTKTHLALESLTSLPSLEFTGLLPSQKFKQQLAVAAEQPGNGPLKLTCKMDILVFGPPFIADRLARGLSRYHLFLQHPHPMSTSLAYKNPQYLDMGGSFFFNGAVLAPIQVGQNQADPDSSNLRNDIDDDNIVDLATVLDDLPKHDYLREVDVDGRIGTTLLSHQKEALDFVMRRESNEDMKPGSLWSLEKNVSGSSLYKHIITSTKSMTPSDILGGILADGMGLGKTLTMIASVVSSLTRAEIFETERPETRSSLKPVRSTLIIVPSVLLLDGWIDEIKKHVTCGFLRYYKYHGPDRQLPSSGAFPYDIVLSTYGTVKADFRRGGGVLNCFHWYRLILDEAHVIRNCTTQQFKAVASLLASIRWCMTGTPIQNSMNDLASLITLLRVPLLDNPTNFRRYIMGRRTTTGDIPRPDYRNLKLLLGPICLRRSTSDILSTLGGAFIECRPRLSVSERRAYNELAILCKQSIQAAANRKPGKGGNKSILIAVLKLRIFCNTGLASSLPSATDDDETLFRPDEVVSLLQQTGENYCAECNSQVLVSGAQDGFVEQNSSRHRIKCRDCAQGSPDIKNTMVSLGNDVTDSTSVAEDDSASALTAIHSNRGSYPSKLVALLANIKEHYHEDKSIVFSFWRRSLDLVGQLFKDEGVKFCRVDGNMKPLQRKKCLDEFQDDSSIRVLLITIGAGAVGLNNLSIASRVHILEPQWNPSVEDQAIGRSFRLGQSKMVCVIRYIMEHTIEESIESRQILKVQLALKGGLQSSNQEVSESQRRITHLRELGRIIDSQVLTRDEGSVE